MHGGDAAFSSGRAKGAGLDPRDDNTNLKDGNKKEIKNTRSISHWEDFKSKAASLAVGRALRASLRLRHLPGRKTFPVQE